jgi:HPt (histidine-containing phosphotransfer) domain-containing protein
MKETMLRQYGINYAAGVSRFLEDAPLYEEMLREFPSDQAIVQLQQAFEKEDYADLFQHAHALKGVSGNLDMERLYRASGELAELLRCGKVPDREQVAVCVQAVCTEYAAVCEGIQILGDPVAFKEKT